jgi:uncharacterized protein (DUF697 family)
MSMNKRKLPKAIQRVAGDVRLEPPADAVTFSADESAAVPLFARQGDIVTMTPARPLRRALVAPPRLPAELNAVRRLARARAIVERHVTYSAAGGLIPLPLVNVGSVTAIILRMVKKLSDLYGVPFERDRARAIVVGLVGGATPTGLGAVASSTLAYLVPASALIGLAVSSVAAVGCTRSIGRIFVDHFESGQTLHEFSVIDGSGRR